MNLLFSILTVLIAIACFTFVLGEKAYKIGYTDGYQAALK